jgi:hypothetical protein
MSPEISRRVGVILGTHFVYPDERTRVIGAIQDAEVWGDIPVDIRSLLADIGQRGATDPGQR